MCNLQTDTWEYMEYMENIYHSYIYVHIYKVTDMCECIVCARVKVCAMATHYLHVFIIFTTQLHSSFGRSVCFGFSPPSTASYQIREIVNVL